MRHLLSCLFPLLVFCTWARAAERIVYPQAAVGPIAGQEFKIELRLGNRNPEQPWTGRLHFLRQSDLQPMQELSVTGPDGSNQARNGAWDVAVPADGSVLYQVSSPTLQVGVLIIDSEQSPPGDLVVSFFYQLHDLTSRVITDLIAVQPCWEAALSYSSMVSQTTGFNVGVALVAESAIENALGPGGPVPTANLGIRMSADDGQLFAAVATLGGEEDGQKALFPNQLISSLPSRFDSARLDITASEPVYVTLLGVGSPPRFEDVQIGAAPAQATSPDGGGEVSDLTGAWFLTTRSTLNTCGSSTEEPVTERVLLIGCGRQLSVINFDGLWGRGVTEGGIIVFAGSDVSSDDFGCPATLVSGGSGSVSPAQIDGHMTTTVSFDPDACGEVSDCTIVSDLTMTRVDNHEVSCFQRAVFPDPPDSDYILPFPAGAAYRLNVSYCGIGFGHSNQLAYDFLMPVGDEVIAARTGTVRFIRDDSPDDGQGTRHNNVQIEHDDGTVAFYAHLKQFGIVVNLGERVEAGQLIAYAGHSGTPDVPHLHFGVYQDYPPIEGQDVAVTFGNALGPLDCRGALVMGETYQAGDETGSF